MRAPRLPSIFKLTEHNRYKRFSYEPRTFDERKEELEKRRLEIEKEMQREQSLGEKGEKLLRERISDSWSRVETRRQQRNSTFRLLLILTILVAIIYAIFSKMDLTL